MKKRLLLDVDGVLCDFVTPVLSFLQGSSIAKTYDQVTGWDMFEDRTDIEDVFKLRIASKPGFCYGLNPLPGAVEFVQKFKNTHEILIATAPYSVPNWYEERKNWIVDKLGLSRKAVCFISQKDFLQGDIFVEDSATNIEAWRITNPGKIPVLIKRPWNRVPMHSDVVQVDSLEELSVLIESGFSSKR